MITFIYSRFSHDQTYLTQLWWKVYKPRELISSLFHFSCEDGVFQLMCTCILLLETLWYYQVSYSHSLFRLFLCTEGHSDSSFFWFWFLRRCFHRSSRPFATHFKLQSICTVSLLFVFLFAFLLGIHVTAEVESLLPVSYVGSI